MQRALNLLGNTSSPLECVGKASKSLKSIASCLYKELEAVVTEAAAGSPFNIVAYVTGIELDFGGIGGSMSKSSVSNGVLYKPNLQQF